MKNLAFIPARGGSKGLAEKNIKEISGKPLIAWSIEQALQSKLINEVIVSTDCEKIAAISKKYGARVPFMRPEYISGDQATTELAMSHCLKYMEEKGDIYDNIVLIQCTSPIRSKNVFDEALNFMQDGVYDSLLSVTKTHRFYWKDLKKPSASYNYLKRPRRQDIDPTNETYIETGSFYISNVKKYMEYENRLFGKIAMFETADIEAYEIDNYMDFVICEALMKMTNKGK